MNILTQLVLTIGRVRGDHVALLGTSILVTPDGKVATPRHVVGDTDVGLVVLLPHISDLNVYQDTTDTRVTSFPARIHRVDPFRDIVVLQTDLRNNGAIPPLGAFDGVSVGDDLDVAGFPHAVDGRRVLTMQRTHLGAKVLLDSCGVKSKHAIVNIQSRPGQSGSAVVSRKANRIVGMLMGAYVPDRVGASINGIDPRELHQTTHCISAEYIVRMISR